MVVLLGLLLLGSQTLPTVEPLNCRVLLERAAPGIEQLCLAEEAMRRATQAPGGSPERVELWRAAADAYARAVSVLQAIEHRKHALEMLVQVNAPTHLRNPESVEQALRGLMELDPSTPQPALRLAKFQEERERLDAAEQTLLFARQQHPEAVELTRDLATFFARRVLALTPKDADGKPILKPAPEPAWKPDCAQMAFGSPGPGVGDICRAEAEMRRGLGRGATPEEVKAVAALSRKQRLAHMDTAADLYRRAVTSLRDTDQKLYVYDALARLYSGANLNEPQQAEGAVQQLIALSPGDVGPIIRLAGVQEDMKQAHVAEQTLISTRQLYPEEVEVMKALSRFYARQTMAATMVQSRSERESEPAAPPNMPDAEGNYRVGGQIPVPKRTEHANPDYPDEARAVGLEGIVIIEIWVDETGQVRNARLVRGIPMLEEVAIATERRDRTGPWSLVPNSRCTTQPCASRRAPGSRARSRGASRCCAGACCATAPTT
jgi:TonB family protein